jgi:lactate dehydrogenase-like 2-hydroxyacid dehydrogenase
MLAPLSVTHWPQFFVFVMSLLLRRSAAGFTGTFRRRRWSRTTLTSDSASRLSSLPPLSAEPLHWNRETSERRSYATNTPIVKQANVISLTDIEDPANNPFNRAAPLPEGVKILAIGATMDDFDVASLEREGANAIFVSHPQAREPLAQLLTQLPEIEWVHTRSAGIDFVTSPTLESWKGKLTNAKGQFSSTLAEYTLMACSFFAKDLPRLMRNKKVKCWDKYNVLELRGATLGIFGYVSAALLLVFFFVKVNFLQAVFVQVQLR